MGIDNTYHSINHNPSRVYTTGLSMITESGPDSEFDIRLAHGKNQ